MCSLIVEDNFGIVVGICYLLEGLGYVVDRVVLLFEVFDLVVVVDYDLVVLDLNFGNQDGLDFLCYLCVVVKVVGVLILIVWGGVQDRVWGFDLGVDDYLVKFFELVEFEVWICVLVCRVGGVDVLVICFGWLSFDIVSWDVWLDGVVLDMFVWECVLL